MPIYFPMHYLGFVGVPRRYYEMYDSEFMTVSTNYLNQFITIVALIVGFTQILFLYNIIMSSKFGKKADKNPWKACSLEWRTPEVPPGHGNLAKNCQLFIVGLMTLMFLVLKKIISLKILLQVRFQKLKRSIRE